MGDSQETGLASSNSACSVNFQMYMFVIVDIFHIQGQPTPEPHKAFIRYIETSEDCGYDDNRI